MAWHHLRVEGDGVLTRVTLDRPDVRNALSVALMQELTAALRAAPGRVVVIAGAGPCFSAGHDLAVAEEGARFATPGVRIGLFCSTPMVPVSRAIGPKRAMQMLLTGDFVDAATARDWGLVNDVVPLDQLSAAVRKLADRIAEASPLVLAMGKRAFHRQVGLDPRQATDLASAVMVANAATDDAREGMQAFLDKRTPSWTGT